MTVLSSFRKLKASLTNKILNFTPSSLYNIWFDAFLVSCNIDSQIVWIIAGPGYGFKAMSRWLFD